MLRSYAEGFAPPTTDGMSDLRVRRRRRAVRARATAAVVGLVVSAVAIGAVLRLATLEPSTRRLQRLTPANVGSLQVEWQRTIPRPAGADAGDRLVVVAGVDGRLVAFEPASGRIAWETWVGVEVEAAPVAEAGVVAVQGVDGVLRVFPEECSSADCAPLWTARSGARAARPAIGKGVVAIVAESGRLSVFPIACSDPCAPLWTAEVGGAEGLDAWLDRSFPLWPRGLPAIPAIGDSRVWDASDGILRAFALDCRTDGGTCSPLVVERPVGRPERFTSSPALGDGRVFVASTSALNAFDARCAADGSCPVLWRAPLGAVSTSRPLVAGSTVVMAARLPRAVFAYPTDCSAVDGLCVGSTWASLPGRTPVVDPAGSGHLVFTATEEGRIEAFPVGCPATPCDPSFGLDVGAPAISVTVWGDRLLVVVTPDGAVRALAVPPSV
jgi:hypothetical protein